MSVKCEHQDKPFNTNPLSNSYKLVKLGSLGGVLFFFLWFVCLAPNHTIPSKKHPVLFYSNQAKDDLRQLFTQAIEQTKYSLFIQIYGCNDPYILYEIQKAFSRGVDVTLFYDPSASPNLQKRFPFAIPLTCKGLMHKKILICDHKKVFIGSANFTPSSLRMHDNLVIGLYSKKLANFLESYSLDPSFTFRVANQKAELWLLPDLQKKCLTRILHILQNASHSIHISLFTFSHPEIVKALVEAHNRGVAIWVAFDFYAAKGASQKTLTLLQKEGISCFVNQGGKLFHHKWALIDEKTLILGSANWTASAFKRNEDCVFILEDLNKKQISYIKKTWKETLRNTIAH